MSAIAALPSFILWNNEEIDLPEELHLDKQPGDDSSFKILTKRDGDFEINYDSTDPKQAAAAKAVFDLLLKDHGMDAHLVHTNVCTTEKSDGTKEQSEPKQTIGDKITELDASKVNHVIFTSIKPSVGG